MEEILNFSSISFVENDDLAEKSSKRSSIFVSNPKLSTMSIQGVNTSDVSKQKNLSMNQNSNNGLTQEQLKEIYSSCIKLSSENKINVKNAFGLQLIDYMQDLLKQELETNSLNSNDNRRRISNGPNFQVAGSTLDASIKIYSYRVDSVHSDAMKMVGTLTNQPVNEVLSDLSNSECCDTEDIEKNPNQDAKETKTNKGKNKPLNKSKLEKNLKNLNLDYFDDKSDIENCYQFPVNMFPLSNDGNPMDQLFLINFDEVNDSAKISLDQNDLVIDTLENNIFNTLEEEDYADIEDMVSELIGSNYAQLTNGIDEFQFNNWKSPYNDNKEQLQFNSFLDNIDLLTNINRNQTQNNTLNIVNNEENDDHDNILNISANVTKEALNLDFDDNFMGGFNPNVSSIAGVDHGYNLDQINKPKKIFNISNVPLNMTGGMSLELSLEPGEYSYFKNINKLAATLNIGDYSVKEINDMLPKMWAGPDHWKHFSVLNQTEKILKELTGMKSLQGLNNIQGKRKRKNHNDNNDEFTLKKNTLDNLKSGIDFMSDLSTKNLNLFKIDKSSSKITLSKTNLAVNSFPDVCFEFDPQKLFRLFLIPKIHLGKTESFKNENCDVEPIEIDNGEIYNYDNENDRLNYCSMPNDINLEDIYSCNNDSGNALELGEENIDITQKFQLTNHFGENVLTGASQRANLAKMSYAKTAKRFNTKKIKNSIWNILSNKEGIPEIQNIDNPNLEASKEVIEFSKMYEKLVQDKPKKSNDNISVPIALVCLLHLANEKNLLLDSVNNGEDIVIKLD